MPCESSGGASNSRWRVWIGGMLVTAAYVLVCGAILHLIFIRFTGDNWWCGTILLFAPRWVLLPPLGIVALAIIVWRPRFLWISLATAVLIIWPTMGFRIGFGEKREVVESADCVTFMTANIGYANHWRIQEEIKRINPDFVVLQESTAAKAEEILGDSWNVAGGHGVCIASRLPILETIAFSAQDVGRWSSPAVAAQIQLPAGRFWLVGVHLETPRWGLEELAVTRRGLEGIDELEANTARRAHESQAVREWINQLPGPLVVAGDFNMPVDSRIYGQYWSSFANAFSECGRGFGYTKYTRWHGIQIDHLLASDQWRIASAEVGSALGGDHRPLIVIGCLEEVQ